MIAKQLIKINASEHWHNRINEPEGNGKGKGRRCVHFFVHFDCTTKEMQWMNACIKTSIMWHILDINAWNQRVERVVVVVIVFDSFAWTVCFFFRRWFRCCDISWSSRTATVNRMLSFRRHNSIFIIYIATITDTIRKSTFFMHSHDVQALNTMNMHVSCGQSLIGSTQHRCECASGAIDLMAYNL